MIKMQHNLKWLTPNWLRVLCLTLLVTATGIGAYAQTLSVYSFAQTSGTYKQAGLGAKTTTSGCYDDGAQGGAITIPFTFTYHGTAFTTIYAQNNGFATLGAATTTAGQYGTVLTGGQVNVLSPLNNDLYGCTTNGADFSYAVVGTSPNQVLTLQWSNWGIYSSGLNEFSFQIKLYENGNKVQYVYKNGTGTNSTAAIVGLNGATTADFQTRTTGTNWSATTAGASASATCTVSSTVRPADGLTFTWASAATVAAMAFTQTTSTYVPIEAASAYTSLTPTAATNYDDTWMGLQTIPWTFTYHGSPYTTIGVSPNGIARFAGNSTNSSNYSVMTSTPDVLSPLNGDLYSLGTQAPNGRDMCVAVVGTAPNRTYVIQWSQWGIYSSGLNEVSFQIRLKESDNSISYVYGPAPGTNGTTTYVGLSGATTADFQGRTTSTNWAATTASAAITNTCTLSSTVRPTNGLTFTWAPPLFTPCTGTPAPGTTVSSAASVCPGTNFTLSMSNAFIGVSNLTFQWQIDPGTGFTNIVGATSATYVTNQTVANSYQCVVTCTGSALSATSTPLNVTVNSFYNCYCTSGSASTADEEIFNVTVGSLNSTSTCATVGPGPGSVNSVYSNYQGFATTPTVSQQDIVPFSLTLGYCGTFAYSNMAAIYIDYNHNGSYTDAGEQVYVKPYGAGTLPSFVVTGNFTVPLSALPGTTGMRVIYYETSVISPCGTPSTWGETEDYLINILAAVPCAGTPTPGGTKANGVLGTVSVCPGNVTFSLENATSGLNVSYQWNNLAGPVVGATNSTYVQNMTAPDEIYCEVTCSGNPTVLSGTSYVNINSFLSCYCFPVMFATNPCSYINTLTTTGAVADITTAVDAGFNGTGNTTFPSTGLTVASSATFNLNVQAQGTCNIAYFSVWIDYNQNGTFDASELVVNNVSTGNTATSFPIAVPGSALTGTTRMRVIDWTNGGAPGPCGALSGYYGENEDYLINIVALPATPAAPVEVGIPNCATGGTLMSGGIAPSGETWYWETSATGTSTAQPVSSNLTILANGTFYVRAQNNTNLTWSTLSSSITVTDFPVGPVDPAIATPGGNPACGSVSLVSSPALAGTTNYWQGTNASGTSTASVADDGSSNTPFNASSNATYYVRAQDNTSFCWSNPVAIAVTINPLPTAPILTATPSPICVGSTSALTAIAPSAPPSGYSVAPITYAPLSPSGATTLGPVGDDVVSGAIPIGFNFSFYGITYSSLVISTNGFLSFDAAPGSGCCAGQVIPNTGTPNNVIAACWTDLYVGAPNSIDYFNLTAPNRLVVRFIDVAHCCGTTPAQYTGQIVIYESGIIEIHNTSATLNGTMTQGIEGPGGISATAVSGRNGAGWTATNDAFRFSPIQPIGFYWTPNGPGSGINAGDETLANITVNPTTPTNYTMLLTDPVNGCQNSASIAVNVLPIPAAPSTTGGSTPCGSGTVTLGASGSGGGTLRWYTAATGGTLVTTGTSYTTPSINASVTYYVEEYNGACSGARTPVTATYTPSTPVTASTNAAAVCAGSSATLTATSANPNYSFTWQPGGMTGASVVVNPSATTTYTLTGVDGFCVNVATVTVTVNPLPNIVSISSTPSSICYGSTSQLIVGVAGAGTGSAPSYCTVTNQGSSCITSVQLNTLNSTPPACVAPYYHINAPVGANTTYLVPGSTYTLSLVTAGTSITSIWIDYNQNGVFEASEWVQPWTAAASGTAIINVPLTAATGATGMRVRSRLNGNQNGAGDGCLAMGSGSTEDYTVTILGANFGYAWTPSGDLNNATIFNPIATPTTAGVNTYSVTVSDLASACTSTSTVDVTVSPVIPAPTGTGGATACGVGTVLLSATGTGAGTLNWYTVATGGSSIATGATYTTPAISATTTYYVDETIGSCTGSRAAVVAVFTAPTPINASSDVAYVCVGGVNNTANLSVTSADPSYSYTWMPGGMTGSSVSVIPTATTTYTVTGIDGPCTAVSTVTVNGPSVPIISSTTASPASICVSGTSQLLVSVVGGTGGLATGYCTPVYTFGCGFPDVITNVTFAGINNTTGTVCGQGANLGYDPIYTTPNPSINAGGTYALSVSTGGDVEGAAVWIDYDHSGTFDPSEEVLNGYAATNPATYSGSVTIPMGATGGQTLMRVRCTYSANATGNPCGSVTFGETEDYYVSIVPAAAFTYAWTPAATLSSSTVFNPSATVAATTAYSVTVAESTYGCSASSGVTVTVNQPSASSTSATNCGPYVWNGNTYTASGSYTYTTTNAVNCDSVATLVLTIACNTYLDITCLIEGYSDGANGLVPVLLNQGVAGATSSDCDTITVVLHDTTAALGYPIVESVQTILHTDGTANCVFTSTGTYYVAVLHRNAVATWSAVPIAVSGVLSSYDFTTYDYQAYGNNQKEVSPNVWAFYSGDIVSDENVDLLDLGALENDISIFAYGWLATDLNGDGNVDLLDSPTLEENISNFVYVVRPQ